MIVPGHTVTCAEQQAEMVGDIVVAAKIERGKSPVGVCVLSLREKFPAEGEVRTEVALHQPAAEGIIPLAGRGIQSGTP
jgi:hypothetical protein